MTPEEIREELGKARVSHTHLLARLEASIGGTATGTASDTFPPGETCDFGAFLSSDRLEPWVLERKPYQVICRLHSRFHELAEDVARLARSGDMEGARDLLDGAFRDAANTLIRAFDKWDGELAQLRGRRASDRHAAE